MDRRLDLVLHQVEQIRTARDELGPRRARRRRHSLGRRARTFVGKGSHVLLQGTSLMASTMLEYAPQRQMLPLMRSRISSGVGCGRAVRSVLTRLGMPALISPSTATAEQICPGVQ